MYGLFKLNKIKTKVINFLHENNSDRSNRFIDTIIKYNNKGNKV